MAEFITFVSKQLNHHWAMIKRIKRFKDKHPFLFIMAIGMLFRFVAVLFSKGFGMHDDHFLVIDPAQSWVDGGDYYRWLPATEGNEGPQGHSLFYVGFHYLIFHFLQLFGIYDPQLKMYFVRTLHAMLSLLVISFGYRIASLISERKTAYKVALLLSIYWFMPFIGVRNLVEAVTIPFLMYGTLILLRQEIIRKGNQPGYHITSFLVAGFFLGIGFSVRYQTIFYTGGLGLALLILGNWKGMLSTAAGFIASVVIFQGGIDFIVWREPFAELIAYVNYNINHAYSYNTMPWYNYLIVIFGILIPPLSVMLLFGYFSLWKKQFLLFFAIFVFLVFHSAFPNKQERFIIPVLPMIMVLGLVGWESWVAGSAFWHKNKKLLLSLWIVFWIFNLTLLFTVTPMYSKRARAEAMTYLKQYPAIKNIMIEDVNQRVIRFPPLFYLKQWPHSYYFMKGNQYDELNRWLDWENPDRVPAFVLFYQPDNLDARVDSLKMFMPGLEFETYVKPSMMDRFIHWLNPVNANESIYIYRNTALIPDKKVKR
ncbi:MAG: glycosyltransferase family 39 protein [Bacteroidales bacterium]|nr:glycosyltransferase family 39 protein [Bacteroidales bacterium]